MNPLPPFCVYGYSNKEAEEPAKEKEWNIDLTAKKNRDFQGSECEEIPHLSVARANRRIEQGEVPVFFYFQHTGEIHSILSSTAKPRFYFPRIARCNQGKGLDSWLLLSFPVHGRDAA